MTDKTKNSPNKPKASPNKSKMTLSNRKQSLKPVYQLSQEEIQEFYEAFCHFDRDNSGTIDTEELGTVLKALGKEFTDEELHEIIEQADVDGSGTIDFPEFVNLMKSIVSQPVTLDDIKNAFLVFDVNGTGQIPREYMKTILMTRGDKMSEEEAEEMVTEADKDGDGMINYEEFASVLMD